MESVKRVMEFCTSSLIIGIMANKRERCNGRAIEIEKWGMEYDHRVGQVLEANRGPLSSQTILATFHSRNCSSNQMLCLYLEYVYIAI